MGFGSRTAAAPAARNVTAANRSTHAALIFKITTPNGTANSPLTDAATCEACVQHREVISRCRNELGYERRSRHAVELSENEDDERLGKQPQLVKTARHAKARERRAESGDRDTRTPSLATAVEQGAQRRADEGKGAIVRSR